MFSEILEQGRILMSMVGCTFIAIGSERRKVGVSALITTWNEEEKIHRISFVFPAVP